MRRFLLFFALLFTSQWAFSQKEFTGKAYYKLSISLYQGEDSDACGDKYGLRKVNIFYNNREVLLWAGRIYNENFSREKEYTKNNKITKVYLRSENYFKNWLGANCHHGDPAERYFEIPNTGYYFYAGHPMHETYNLTLKSYPYVKLDAITDKSQTEFSSNDILKVTLPDNLESKHLNWKYQIAKKSVQDIPKEYNNKNILEIPLSKIITDKNDYGKIVSLWVHMGSIISEEQAKKLAQNAAYSSADFIDCINRYTNHPSGIEPYEICEKIVNIDSIKKVALANIREEYMNFHSNRINFTVIPAGPKILESSRAIPPRCSDEYGSIILKFDRKLEETETNVKFFINDHAVDSERNKKWVNQLRGNITTINIENLASGTHKIKLEGQYKGNPFKSNIKEFTIQAPTPVTFSEKHIDVYCHGANDGKITLNAKGGKGGYQYTLNNTDWINFNNGESTTIPNLKGGTYKISVKDRNGCIAKENGETKKLTVVITEPDAVLHLDDDEETIQKPSGYGKKNGFIAVTVKGGTPKPDGSYFYEWRKASPTGTILSNVTVSTNDGFGIRLNEIGAGKYYLTLKDANYNKATNKGGCGIISKEFIVTQPSQLETTITLQQPISCNPNNKFAKKIDANRNNIHDYAEDGSIGAKATGGVKPYKYQWQKEKNGTFTNLKGENKSLLENIAAGTYKIIVTDSKENETSQTYTVINPSEIKLTVSGVNIICNGAHTGEAKVIASGGRGSYSYAWSNGATTPKVKNLAAGEYEVLVSDGKQCAVRGEIVLTQPKEVFRIQKEVVATPTGYGLSNGNITVVIAGGTPNANGSYSYEWRKDSYTGKLLSTTTAQKSNGSYTINLNDLKAGKYFLIVKDKNYNAAKPMDCLIIRKEFKVTEPEPLKLKIVAEKHISCHIANNYNEKIDKDKNGIPDEAEDGVLKAIVTGGIQPYTYEWQKEDNGTFKTIKKGAYESVEKLTEGNYKLKIVDGGGNTIEATQNLLFPPKLTISLTKKDLVCHNVNTGQISSVVNGGKGSYSYSWNKGKYTTSSIKDLNAGKYAVVVTDTNGCAVEEEVELLEPAKTFSILENSIKIKEPTGYGLTNGDIHLKVIGGTSKSDGTYHYEFHKDTPEGEPLTTTESKVTPQGFSIKLHTIGAGKYYLIVKDKNYSSSNPMECLLITKEFIINQPKPLLSEIKATKLISCNIANKYDYKEDADDNGIPDEAEDGVLNVKVEGGVGTYHYQWQKKANGKFYNIAEATHSSLNKVTAGSYKVIVRDDNNNTTTSEYEMKYPEELKLKLSAQNVACYGAENGKLSAKVSGGTGTYRYQWNTLEKTSEIAGIPAGNYFVLVTDDNGCNVNGNVEITQPEQVIIEDIVVQNPLAPSANNGKIKVKLSGGEPPYTISWSNGMAGEEITSLPQGKYIVTVTDAKNCTQTKEYTLTDPDKLQLDLGKDVITLCKDEYKEYDVTINDANASYQWTDKSGNIISSSPKIVISKEGTYTVKVTNSYGNTASDTVTVYVSDAVLQPEFMLTTHAYTERSVMLVNTTKIQPEKVEWILPENQDIQVLNETEEYLELQFSKIGKYEIGLKGMQGNCEKTFYKEIFVEENVEDIEVNPTTISNIKEFAIVPNPNNGEYKVIIKLHKPQSIKLRTFSMTTQEPYAPVLREKAEQFEIPFNVLLSPGLYLIILETENEAQVKKMIVQ